MTGVIRMTHDQDCRPTQALSRLLQDTTKVDVPSGSDECLNDDSAVQHACSLLFGMECGGWEQEGDLEPAGRQVSMLREARQALTNSECGGHNSGAVQLSLALAPFPCRQHSCECPDRLQDTKMLHIQQVSHPWLCENHIYWLL